MIHGIVASATDRDESAASGVGQQSLAIDDGHNDLTLTSQRRARQNRVKRS